MNVTSPPLSGFCVSQIGNLHIRVTCLPISACILTSPPLPRSCAHYAQGMLLRAFGSHTCCTPEPPRDLERMPASLCQKFSANWLVVGDSLGSQVIPTCSRIGESPAERQPENSDKKDGHAEVGGLFRAQMGSMWQMSRKWLHFPPKAGRWGWRRGPATTAWTV